LQLFCFRGSVKETGEIIKGKGRNVAANGRTEMSEGQVHEREYYGWED